MADDVQPGKTPEPQAALDAGPGLALALDGARYDPALREHIAGYLADQRTLIADQREHLRAEHRHASLSYFSARLKVTLQLLTIAAGAVVLLGLARLAWEAHAAGGLVIEAFSVPPDLARDGVTGQAAAAQLQDEIARIQKEVDGRSSRAPDSFANNWGREIKVEIPQTGVSLGELDRALRAALGHETHISGEIIRTPQGLAMSTRVGGEPGERVSGTADDIDGLIHRAALAVFARAQPYRYALYLIQHGRPGEAQAVLHQLADSTAPDAERAWGYMGLATAYPEAARQLEHEKAALKLEPRLTTAWLNLASTQLDLGHNADAVEAWRSGLAVLREGRGLVVTPQAAAVQRGAASAFVAEHLGDYGAADAAWAQVAGRPGYFGSADSAVLARAQNLARLHDVTSAARLAESHPADAATLAAGFSGAIPRYFIAVQQGDWPRALAEVTALDQAAEPRPFGPSQSYRPGVVWPLLAEALARNGRLAEAEAVIGQTPADCYDCRRAEGRIAALEQNWDRAEALFAQAIRLAPALPAAWADRGAARLEAGELDGAVADARAANERAPRFADPLELWGEALLRKGQYGRAIGKFRAAATLAPRWGRLHLKWGEALAKAGEAGEARSQWRAAATLDLNPRDRVELNEQLAGVQSGLR